MEKKIMELINRYSGISLGTEGIKTGYESSLKETFFSRYFNDKSTFSELLINQINKRIYDICISENLYIAGGSILCAMSSRALADIDIFSHNVESLESAIKILSREVVINNIIETENAKTFNVEGLNYQFIYKPGFVGEPERVLSKFDLSICMFGFIPSTGCLLGDDLSWLDLENHRLRYMGSQNPIQTLLRMIKYIQRGFIPEGEDLEAAELDLQTMSEVEILEKARVLYRMESEMY